MRVGDDAGHASSMRVGDDAGHASSMYTTVHVIRPARELNVEMASGAIAAGVG
jgi:hypothetical protein